MKNSEGDSHCFAAVFVAWKKRARPKFTWGSLINALKSINVSELAETLGEKIVQFYACLLQPVYYYIRHDNYTFYVLCVSAGGKDKPPNPLGK